MIEVWIGIAAVLVTILAILHYIVNKKNEKSDDEPAANIPANREVG